MTKLIDLFGQDKIEIFSPNPKDLTNSKDIKALILWKYPNVIVEYLVVSQPHANSAILVGDNINYQGWIEVFIKQKERVYENANKWYHTVQSSNYTLTKLVRTGIAPLSAMIGTSAYYELIGNPILGSINALLFSKKLGIDIWNLNQRPTTRNKVINSYKKIFLGLGTIVIANYSKWIENTVTPIIPTTTIPSTTTTDTPPWPPMLGVNINSNNNYNQLMDWDTYISLNVYGIANLMLVLQN